MVQVDGHGATSSLIQVRGLDKKYKRGSEEIHVLQGLNLDVDQGEFVAFMGPSGSGKTTLLNLLGGLDVPSAGSIVVSDPTFLLCDEPTGDLDRKSADEIMALIERLVREYRKTVLMVTHDPVVAQRADTTLHLEKGALVEAGQRRRVPAGGVA